MELVKINDLAQLLALADDDSFVIGSGDNAQRITWAELKTLLSELYSDVNAVSNHDSSDTAHGDIRDLIADMVIELRSEASSHNSSKMAHADIRDLIKELAAEASRLNQSKSNAIVRTLKGKAIVATDSSKAGFAGLRIFGRSEQGSTTGAQLLNYDAWVGTDIVYGTAVYENNGVTITATEDDAFTWYKGCRIPVSEGDVVTLSWEESTNASGTIYIFGDGVADYLVMVSNSSAKKLSYTVPSGITFVTFRFGVTYAGETISYKNIMVNKGDTALPWEPYTGGIASPNPDYQQEIVSVGDGGSVGVGGFGKNLLEITAKTQTMNGVTFTVNEDGSVTVNGTATAACYYVVRASAENIYKGCKLSGCPNGGSSTTYSLIAQGLDEDYKYQSTSQDNGNGAEIPNTPNVRIEILVRNGVTVSNATFHPMLRYASITDDTYEPYQKQSAIFTTPNGLPGIKVTDSSLATYTDSDGQMWCADEVDLERGVYVKRIAEKNLATLQTWNQNSTWTNLSAFYNTGAMPDALPASGYFTKANIMCNRLLISTAGDIADSRKNAIAQGGGKNVYVSVDGVETAEDLKAYFAENETYIRYILATPIETPLSVEEIAKYKALHTNYPTTTVMNDSGADMEVEYVADPANHISQNYVPKASYTELEARVSALEQLAINS